jgi:hypothetical protein
MASFLFLLFGVAAWWQNSIRALLWLLDLESRLETLETGAPRQCADASCRMNHCFCNGHSPDFVASLKLDKQMEPH